MGRSKEATRIQLQCIPEESWIPEKRDALINVSWECYAHNWGINVNMKNTT